MIVFITKSLCYHQVFVADSLYQIYGNSFVFVQMRSPLEWRVANKQEGFERPYLITYPNSKEKVAELVKTADVIVFGEAPLKLIRKRNKKCLLFKMSENIYKDSQYKVSFFGTIKRRLSYLYLKMLTNNNNSYLLACSGFAYNDYEKLHLFKGRALKWGYFPFIPNYSLDQIHAKYKRKDTIELVWISRLVKYKNPLFLIFLVEHLLSKGLHNFHINVVGDSSESDVNYYSELKNQISKNELSKFIKMVGKVEADKVFDYYKNAHIALFTSDKSEGWSVGVGEAMSCGCAVVCSNVIGSAPFMIDESNGYIFNSESENDFALKVEMAINNLDNLENMAIVGYQRIHTLWNHNNAAKNLSKVIDEFLKIKNILC